MKLSRRKILKQASAMIVAAPVGLTALQSLAKSEAKNNSKSALKLVDPEKDPVAKGLGYVHDASKAKRTDKMGVKANEQFCHNCALYTAQGKIGKDEVGKCTMIQSGLVKGNGWCNSWMKKS